jgi:hypothetical protein
MTEYEKFCAFVKEYCGDSVKELQDGRVGAQVSESSFAFACWMAAKNDLTDRIRKSGDIMKEKRRQERHRRQAEKAMGRESYSLQWDKQGMK